MIVWDVQHGNAIYVKTPNNKHLVFDLGIGGYSGHNQTFSPLGALWHSYNVRKLDFVMITHPHLDHIDDILNLDFFSPAVFHRPRHLTYPQLTLRIVVYELVNYDIKSFIKK